MFFKKPFFHQEYKISFFFLSFFSLATFCAFVLYSNVFILSQFGSGVERADSSSVTSTTAIVFGGGMEDGTTMSRMQEERMVTAVRLYQEGRVKQLILTGDDGGNRFDEVSAMYGYALDAGVSPQDLILDWYGYRTYDSCYRAKYTYHMDNVLFISQTFHLPRIMYLCSEFGVKGTGISADQSEYRGWWTPTIREVLARAKAVVEVVMTHPTPSRLLP